MQYGVAKEIVVKETKQVYSNLIWQDIEPWTALNAIAIIRIVTLTWNQKLF